MAVEKVYVLSVTCTMRIEWVVGNSFMLSGWLLLYTCFAAGEEGSIVTHNRSVTVGEGKISLLHRCFHQQAVTVQKATWPQYLTPSNLLLNSGNTNELLAITPVVNEPRLYRYLQNTYSKMKTNIRL